MQAPPCGAWGLVPHDRRMAWRDIRKKWRESPAVQTGLFLIGIVLMIASPIFGALPGPGGIFVFAAGLALTLKNSLWAKRQYVRFKSWQPRAGRWTDWGLRRKSAERREARRRMLEEMGILIPEKKGKGPIDPIIPNPPKKPLDQLLKPGKGD